MIVKGKPKSKFLRQAHDCNYCGKVKGVSFEKGPVKARILRVECACGKRHYICRGCAGEVGFSAGKPIIATCAKGYRKRQPKGAAE